MRIGVRYGLWVAVMVGVALVPGEAQTSAPATAPDLEAMNRRLDEALAKLREGPGVKEVYELQKKVADLDSKRYGEVQLLIQEMDKLEQTDAYKNYEQQARALQSQRDEEWSRERKKMAAAARLIYAARHEELAMLRPSDLPGARALGFDVLSFPKIDGSTSTQPLAVILASRMLNVPYQWAYPEATGNPWRPDPALATDRVPGAALLPNQNMEFALSASQVFASGNLESEHRIAAVINGMLAANTNTHDAYVNLINGTCAVNLTAREPSADEIVLAKQKNVEIELVPIAMDALVFIVHQGNPVKNLSLEQIREIYGLKTTKWAMVGGEGKRIMPFLRELNSGSRELFDNLVMRTPTDRDYQSATGNLYAYSMSGPYNRVTQEPEGIGYSVYYYEHFMAMSPYTRSLSVNGVEPSYSTLASGTYPLRAPVFAALRKSDGVDAPGPKLVAFLRTSEGKRLIRESGYVPFQ